MLRTSVFIHLQFVILVVVMSSDVWTNSEKDSTVPCRQLWLQVVQKIKASSSKRLDADGTQREPGNFADIGCGFSAAHNDVINTILLDTFGQALRNGSTETTYEKVNSKHRLERSYNVRPPNVSDNLEGSQKRCAVEETPTRSKQPNLNGVELRVTTSLWPPYVRKMTDDQGNQYAEGFSIDLLNEMSELLNFTYVLDYKQKSWGSLLENGSWTGMVGKLERREIDLIIGNLGYQAERSLVMDFTIAYDDMVVTMWMLDPRQRPQIWLALFDMLDLTVTGLLLGAIVILSIILTISSNIAPTGRPPEPVVSCFLNKAFILLGATLAQGCRAQTLTSTGRMIIATWWIFSVVFSITYSAMLIASLSANSSVLPFETVASMRQQNEYRYGFVGDSSEQMFFEQVTNISEYRALWMDVKRASVADSRLLSPNYSVHAEMVTREKYAFMGVRLPWDDFGVDAHSVLKFGDVFYGLRICFGLQKNSPYTEVMSDSLALLLQHGVISRLKNKWFGFTTSPSTEVGQVTGIPLRTLSGVFFTGGIGLGISVVLLILEVVATRLMKWRRKHRQD